MDGDVMMDWSEKSVKSFPTTFVEPETEDDDACSLVRNDLPFCGRNRMLQDWMSVFLNYQEQPYTEREHDQAACNGCRWHFLISISIECTDSEVKGMCVWCNVHEKERKNGKVDDEERWKSQLKRQGGPGQGQRWEEYAYQTWLCRHHLCNLIVEFDVTSDLKIGSIKERGEQDISYESF